MKKYIGYYIIGASNKKDAHEKKGLLLWSQTKPSGITRFFNRVLLGIYWIDETQMLEEKGKTKQSQDGTTEMTRLVTKKKKSELHKAHDH